MNISAMNNTSFNGTMKLYVNNHPKPHIADNEKIIELDTDSINHIKSNLDNTDITYTTTTNYHCERRHYDTTITVPYSTHEILTAYNSCKDNKLRIDLTQE